MGLLFMRNRLSINRLSPGNKGIDNGFYMDILRRGMHSDNALHDVLLAAECGFDGVYAIAKDENVTFLR